jgi:hypothetical protein
MTRKSAKLSSSSSISTRRPEAYEPRPSNATLGPDVDRGLIEDDSEGPLVRVHRHPYDDPPLASRARRSQVDVPPQEARTTAV